MTEHINLPYFNNTFDRELISNDTDYGPVIELLDLPEVMEEVRSGNVTLAMIRPNVGPRANIQGLSDSDCANMIEEMIFDLGVLAKFSFQFTEETVDEFYSGAPQATMEGAEAEDPDMYESRWPEFKVAMSSGPATVLLLYSENGDAIEKWRGHLGHWNIAKNRDPSTIRGKLAVNIFNNLVHGSDASDSVQRELVIIKNCLVSASS